MDPSRSHLSQAAPSLGDHPRPEPADSGGAGGEAPASRDEVAQKQNKAEKVRVLCGHSSASVSWAILGSNQ
jgi:hypothetical protein